MKRFFYRSIWCVQNNLTVNGAKQELEKKQDVFEYANPTTHLQINFILIKRDLGIVFRNRRYYL